MVKQRIGIIGCGVISEAYLTAAPKFPILDVVACADLLPEAAQAKADQFGIKALGVDDLLADPSIDIVLNLTTPAYHVSVGCAALRSGKHVYSEKPLGVSLDDARGLVELAGSTGLRVGSAPDTFLGGSHQTARRVLDEGTIGQPVAASANMMVPGHERWHPNPDFYYTAGGGPMLDMGPYYLTDLIQLLGPVASVMGSAKASYDSRTIGSGPREGQTVPVEVPTHISGILNFANGATGTITTSFDIWNHDTNPIEIYGQTGSMLVPDPNRFDGEVMVADKLEDWQPAAPTHLYGDGNYRILGLADMAHAIAADRPHRAGLELSFHVLEVMLAFTQSAEEGRRIDIESRCERPAPMPTNLPFGTLD